MPDPSELYKFFKDNDLTTKDEASFVNEYSNPDKAKELYGFLSQNNLTTKDYDAFYGDYFQKKSPSQSVPFGQDSQNTSQTSGQLLPSFLTEGGPQERVTLGNETEPVEQPQQQQAYQPAYDVYQQNQPETNLIPTPLSKKGSEDYVNQVLLPKAQQDDLAANAVNAWQQAHPDTPAPVTTFQQLAARPIESGDAGNGGGRGAYLYNRLLDGVSSIAAGAGDVVANVMAYMPNGGIPSPTVMSDEQIAEQRAILPKYRKEVAPAIRNTVGMAKMSVSEQNKARYDNEFFTNAIGGLVESAPAMLSGPARIPAFFLQGYDQSLQAINQADVNGDLSEVDKTLYSTFVGAVNAKLENIGFERIFGNGTHAVSQQIVNNAVEAAARSGKKVTGDAMTRFLNTATNEFQSRFLRSAGRAVEGFGIEAATGGAQEAVTAATEYAVNALKGKEIFDHAEGAWDTFTSNLGRITASAAAEGVGGFVMGGGAGLISKRSRTTINDHFKDIQSINESLNDPNIDPDTKSALLQSKLRSMQEVSRIAQEDADEYNKLKPAQKERIDEINEQIQPLANIVNSPDVSEEAKAVAQKQVDDLSDQAEEAAKETNNTPENGPETQVQPENTVDTEPANTGESETKSNENRSTEESKTSKAPEPSKPISQMTSREISDYAEEIRKYDDEVEARLFGEENANKYKAALRTINSSTAINTERYKTANAFIDKMEASLTDTQRDELDRVDVPDRRDLNEIAQQVNWVETAETKQDLAREVGKILTDMNRDNPSDVHLASLNAARNRASELGMSTEELIRDTTKSIASRYEDPSDAELMVSDALKKLAPKSETTTMSPQQALPEKGQINLEGQPVAEPSRAVQVSDESNPQRAAQSYQSSFDRLTEDMTLEQIEADPELVKLRDKAKSLNTAENVTETTNTETTPTATGSAVVGQRVPESSSSATSTEQNKPTKEGVDEVFKNNPGLSKIGTPQQYSEYLDTIFPDSEVKDIVYHRSKNKFDKFEDNRSGENMGNISKIMGSGIFFNSRDEPGLEEFYGDNLYPSLINLKEGSGEKRTLDYRINNASDTHILGSSSDIEGFKKFVSNQNIGGTSNAVQKSGAKPVSTQSTPGNSSEVGQGISQPEGSTGTQEAEQSPEVAQGEGKIGDASRNLAAKIRQGKISKLGGFKAGTGFDAVWDGALETVATTLETGATVADAIEAGLKKAKQTKWYKGLVNKKDFDQKFRDHLTNELSEEAPSTTTETEEPTASTPEKKTTGTTQEQINATRSGLGLEEYRSQRQSDANLQKQASESLKNGYNITALISKLSKGDFPTALEQKIMQTYISSLEAVNNENPTPDLLKRINEATSLVAARTSDIARSLRAVQGDVSVQDNLSNFLMEEAKAYGVDTLPQSQIDKLKGEYTQGQEAKQAYEEGYKKAYDEYMKKLADFELNKAKNAARKAGKKTKTEYATERSKIRDSIRAKLKTARSQTNANVIPYLNELIAVSPDIARLVRSYVEEGVSNLSDIIKNIHSDLQEDIPDITQNDVRDLIAGKYNAPVKTRSEVNNQLSDLKAQAKILARIEAIENGEAPKTPSQERNRSTELEELQQRLRDIQKRQSDTDNVYRDDPEDDNSKRLQRRKDWLNKKIQEMQTMLETGNLETEVKAKPALVLDAETVRLKDEYIDYLKKVNQRRDQARYDQLSPWRRGWDSVMNVLGLRRVLQTSFDLSMLFRQAVTVTINPRFWMTGAPSNVVFDNNKISRILNRTTAGRSLYAAIKGMASHKFYDRMMFDIHNDPDYHNMVEDGLVFGEVDAAMNQEREEDFRRSIIDRIPVLRDAVRASERSAASTVNSSRYEIYKRFEKNLMEQGITRESSPESYKYAAKWAMTMTGRGHMMDALERSPQLQRLLGNTFYGARLMASRFNILNPKFYMNMPKQVRVQALKDMAGYTSGFIAVGLGFAAAGFKVGFDPDKPEFLQARKGNTVIDFGSGGMAIYVRTFARILKASYLRLNPAIYGSNPDKAQLKAANDRAAFASRSVLTFFRNKLAPNTGYLLSAFTGTNSIGQPFDPNEFFELYPMYTEDLYNALQKEDAVWTSMGVMIPNIIGMSINEFKERPGQYGDVTEFRANKTTYQLTNDQVDQYKKYRSQYKEENKDAYEGHLNMLIDQGKKKDEAKEETDKWFDSRSKAYAKAQLLDMDASGDTKLFKKED